MSKQEPIHHIPPMACRDLRIRRCQRPSCLSLAARIDTYHFKNLVLRCLELSKLLHEKQCGSTQITGDLALQ